MHLAPTPNQVWIFLDLLSIPQNDRALQLKALASLTTLALTPNPIALTLTPLTLTLTLPSGHRVAALLRLALLALHPTRARPAPRTLTHTLARTLTRSRSRNLALRLG